MAIPLSPSVQSATQRFAPEEHIVSWVLVRHLLEAHPEYGGGAGRELSTYAGPEIGTRRTASDWIRALSALFDPSRVRQLHGRIAILGLGLLDPALQEFLTRTGFQKALESELDEPLSNLLVSPPDETSQSAVSDPSEKGSEVPSDQSGDHDPEPGVAALRILASGYTSDSVEASAVDRLEIEREVQVLAHLLASRAVRPPLSLGLFGDWGTGKSFFMSMLRSYIVKVANHYRKEEQKTGVPADWCTRVLQIEFNAWHYSDANLWASLVTRIYAALQNELQPGTPDEELKEQLEAEVRRAEGVARAAAAQIKQAEKWVEKASGDLQRTKSEVVAKELQLDGMIGNIGGLLHRDPRLKVELDEAARVLGMPQAAVAYDSLRELRANLSSVSGRLSAIAVSSLRSKGALPLLVLFALAAPAVVSWVIARPELNLAAAGQRVIEISTIFVGVVAWMQRQLTRGVGYLHTVEQAVEKAELARQERIENDEEVSAAVRELALAHGAQEAARQNLENSQAELQKLRAELDELGLERRLFRLIDERSRSATYTQHLGIISLIREDFETISSLFARLDKEDRDLKQQPPPIQRIILYIDDLDRCPAERVVQVLEAVHMLLAFPLFTVVVGVDPRWLRESLNRVHTTTLREEGGAVESSASYSTPQDYLEKIFQIPFALRRVEKTGYENLVADLLEPQRFTTPAPKPRPQPADAASDAGASTATGGEQASTGVTRGAADEGAARPDLELNEVKADGPPLDSAHEGEPDSGFRPIQATSLEFTPQEKRDINALWPLFTTPRGVKRFINTYRLLRASVPEATTASFEGTEEEPGEYQIALLLLAIASSSPNELGALKEALLGWTRREDPNPRQSTWRWSQVLRELRDEIIELDPDWEGIDSSLATVIARGFQRPFTRQEVARWVGSTARYTFSVLPPRNVSGAWAKARIGQGATGRTGSGDGGKPVPGARPATAPPA